MMAFGDDARGDADMAEPLLLGESAAAEREQRVLAATLAETRQPQGGAGTRGKDEDDGDGFEFISERETLVFEGDRFFRGQGGASDAGGLFTAYFMSKIQPGSGACSSINGWTIYPYWIL